MSLFASRSSAALLAPLAVVTPLLVQPAAAQPATEAALPPVVVTATRTSQMQSEPIAHTTVLTAEDIQRAGASDVPSLLRREAGIQISRNGGMGSSTGLFLRGTDTRQTLVLLDGVPMNRQDATGVSSIEQIPLDQVERIEIVRGNVSAIYGSGAVGGVIQIFTKTGTGQARTNVTAEVGSHNTLRLAAGLRGAFGETAYALNVSGLRTDGFSAMNPGQGARVNPDDDGFRNRSLSGSVSHPLTKAHSIGLNFLLSKGDSGYDSSFFPDVPATIHERATRASLVSLVSKNRFSESWQSEFTLSQFDDKDQHRKNGAFQFSSHTETTQFLWNNTVQLTSNWTATAGFEHRDESSASNTSRNPSRNLNGVHGGLLGQIDKHQLQANVRHDRYSDVGSATTGYLGYGYGITEALKATASYSTAFTAAPLGYLYSPGFGNPNLRPEETRTAEVGLQHASSGGLLKAVYFKSETTDQFAYVFPRFENVQRVENKGVELSYSGRIAAIDLNASLTLQEPRNAQTGMILTRRARTLASLGASRTFGAFTMGGDVQYTGGRSDGAQALERYTLVNLNARYQLNKDVKLFARIENVTDKTYQTAYGYNQAPRGVFVGVNWQH